MKPAVAVLCIAVAAGLATRGSAMEPPVSVSEAADASAGEFEAIARSVQPGQWRLIPRPVSAVFYKQGQISETTWGVVGPNSIVWAWNGGAYDPVRRELHLHGGGHADYGGNEVLTFSFKTLQWRRSIETYDLPRITPRRPCPQPDREADGPPSGHTYDSLVWSQRLDAILYFQTHGYCMQGDAVNDPAFRRSIWLADPRKGEWRRLGPAAENERYVATVELPDGRIVAFGNNGPARIYDPTTNKYVRAGERVNWEFPQATYAPDRDMIYINEWGRIMRLDPKTLRASEIIARSALGAGLSTDSSIVYHPPSRRLVLWDGGRRIVLLDPDTANSRIVETTGTAPRGARPWSKFIYLPELDVFAGVSSTNDGVWVYRLPDKPQALAAPGRTFAELVAAARGSEIVVPPGRYYGGAVIGRSGITIKAAGAHLSDVAGDKAAVVVTGNDVTIEGLEISLDEQVSGNHACIRLEGRNLTLRRIHCHDTQMGFLGGGAGSNGVVVIEGSLFERTGLNGNANLGHAIYAFSTGLTSPGDELIVRGTTIRDIGVRRPGHGIKSRAPKNTIEGNVIAGLGARNARLIDMSNGGTAVISGNVLQSGPNADNDDMIGLARERATPPGYIRGRVVVTSNVFVSDRATPSIAVTSRVDAADGVVVRGNTLVGAFQRDLASEAKWPVGWGDNRTFANRGQAGLPAYPQLPEARRP